MGTIAQPGGRGARARGRALRRARWRDKARLVAAEMLECAPEDVVLAEGRARVARRARARAWRLGQVARAAVRSTRCSRRRAGRGCSACAFFYPDTVTWAFGAQAGVVEVDLEAVRDRAAPALRRGARLRAAHQPDDRGGPAPRRHRPGHRQRADARRSSTTTTGQLLTGTPDGLRDAPRRRHAAARVAHIELPVRDQRPGHQGRGRERRHLAAPPPSPTRWRTRSPTTASWWTGRRSPRPACSSCCARPAAGPRAAETQLTTRRRNR